MSRPPKARHHPTTMGAAVQAKVAVAIKAAVRFLD